MHIRFDDPAEAVGSDEEMMAVFRRVRDEIRLRFKQFYLEFTVHSGKAES
jgi:arsenate reductase